jgi:Domain of unknown function (DUF5666)/Domain of unknown function (DUF4382)
MQKQLMLKSKHFLARLWFFAVPSVLAATALIWIACGSGGNGGFTAGGALTATQLKIGDAPADGVAAFELTINSISLTPSAGGTPVTILSTPTRVELTHTSGTFEPLAVANIPAGSYSSASIAVSDAEVVIINPATGQPQQLTAVLGSPTLTVNLNPAVTISPTASVLVFDLDLANSLVINGGVATVTPVFAIRVSTVAAQNQQDDENGEIEDVTGVVTGVSGSTFTISLPQGASPLTFATNSATLFDPPLTNLASIQAGMVLEVDAVTQTNGTLLATKVEADVEVANGLELEGFVTSVTGTPATQFQMVVQESASPVANPPSPGTVLTVNIASNTNFRIDDSHIDLSGLNFTFDTTSLRPGQSVEVDVEPPIGAPPTAKKVILKRQALNGTISNLTTTGATTATFTLTVDAAFSAFALVSNQATLTVFRQPGTELKNLTALSNGQPVRVRGLVFFDTATSSFTMVAGRITP